jgi:AraC-like DNA-binding protein
VPRQRARTDRVKDSRVLPSAPERLTLSVASVAARQDLEVRAASPSLVMTIEAAIVVATCRGVETPVDRSTCLLVPAGSFVTVQSHAPASRTAVLAFHPPLLAATAATYGKLGVTRARFTRWLEEPHVLSRTVWLHEIVHRYVFERDALREDDNDATRFLEVEILKEIYFLLRDRAEGGERASLVRAYSPLVERTLGYIHAHLFEPISVPRLAAHARASESTLLRTFRREMGCAASEYWRTRKLDEALVLLRSGRLAVGAIAAEVGYTNATAFAFAFRQRFGDRPSAFLPRARVRRAP